MKKRRRHVHIQILMGFSCLKFRSNAQSKAQSTKLKRFKLRALICPPIIGLRWSGTRDCQCGGSATKNAAARLSATRQNACGRVSSAGPINPGCCRVRCSDDEPVLCGGALVHEWNNYRKRPTHNSNDNKNGWMSDWREASSDAVPVDSIITSEIGVECCMCGKRRSEGWGITIYGGARTSTYDVGHTDAAMNGHVNTDKCCLDLDSRKRISHALRRKRRM